MITYYDVRTSEESKNKTITCPLDFSLGMTGALRSLHSTCLSFRPLSTSFIMSDQSGRLLGRLRNKSSFFIFSGVGGFFAKRIEYLINTRKSEHRGRRR